MSDMVRNVYKPADVRELDRIAIEEQGIAGYTLMARAAAATLAAGRERFPDAQRWLVLCGSGNNGGDGYVIARLAKEQGLDVTVIAVSPPEKLGGDAATAWQDYVAVNGSIAEWSGAADLQNVDIVVDALLGTGLERELGGIYLELVNALGENTAPVIAVDIPTGLNGVTGHVMGAAVRAELTVTFVGLKQGAFFGGRSELLWRGRLRRFGHSASR
jgi:hydroxyethylthiazole kinase-like uncharacterized protein yjeF